MSEHETNYINILLFAADLYLYLYVNFCLQLQFLVFQLSS